MYMNVYVHCDCGLDDIESELKRYYKVYVQRLSYKVVNVCIEDAKSS